MRFVGFIRGSIPWRSDFEGFDARIVLLQLYDILPQEPFPFVIVPRIVFRLHFMHSAELLLNRIEGSRRVSCFKQKQGVRFSVQVFRAIGPIVVYHNTEVSWMEVLRLVRSDSTMGSCSRCSFEKLKYVELHPRLLQYLVTDRWLLGASPNLVVIAVW